MAGDAQNQSQSVGFLLGVGIFFLPFVFVWFLLRKGYSAVARAIGFTWFAFSVIGFVSIAGSGDVTPEKVAQADASSQSAQRGEVQNGRDSNAKPDVKELEVFSASDIAQAYKDNEFTADQKYKGKQFIVTGTVDKIGTGAFNSVHIDLDSDDYLGIRLELKNDHRSYAGEVSKGDSVRMACTGDGNIFMPQLKNCVPKPE